MRSAVKIALEVTEGQATLLDSQSKIANWLYNQLLERANGLRSLAFSQSAVSVSQDRLLLGAQECRVATVQSDQGLPGWQTWAARKSRQLAEVSHLETQVVLASIRRAT